jgi:hypothetical protein
MSCTPLIKRRENVIIVHLKQLCEALTTEMRLCTSIEHFAPAIRIYFNAEPSPATSSSRHYYGPNQASIMR